VILGAFLDRIAPWLRWIAFAVIIAASIAALLLVNQCSRQEAAQSKQDARSAQAGTKTAVEALDTLQEAQERDAGTDRIVIIGKKEVADAQTDVDADAAARRAICGMQHTRDQPACRVFSVHP